MEAGAGLAGSVGAEGYYGKSYAGAAAGGVSTVVKEKTVVSQPALSGTFVAKTVATKPVAAVEVHKEIVVPGNTTIEAFYSDIFVIFKNDRQRFYFVHISAPVAIMKHNLGLKLYVSNNRE